MNTNQRSYQSGQGSKVDQTKHKKVPYDKSTKKEIEEIEAIDDDFLSGDNKKKTYPNNHNNPTPGYNEKSLAPNPGSNPNIGGDENEYEDSTSEENRYDEEGISSNIENNPEEENKEYKSPDKGYNFDLFLEF